MYSTYYITTCMLVVIGQAIIVAEREETRLNLDWIVFL